MTEIEYEDYQGMIHSEVWKRVKKNGNADPDELLSAGNLAFMEARESWKPEKGAFSTHLWNRLRFRLGKLPKANRPVSMDCLLADLSREGMVVPKESTRPTVVYLEDIKAELPTEGSGFFAAQLTAMSQEAQYVVGLIFSAGEELVDMTADHVRTTKKGLRQYLRGEGWPGKIITAVFEEIKEVVS